jgi:hypothetical protein
VFNAFYSCKCITGLPKTEFLKNKTKSWKTWAYKDTYKGTLVFTMSSGLLSPPSPALNLKSVVSTQSNEIAFNLGIKCWNLAI